MPTGSNNNSGFEVKPPSTDEYNPFYQTYVNLAKGHDLLRFLDDQRSEFLSLLQGLSETKQNHSYAEGKWTVKQLLRHIIDAERIFSYRAMAIARKDKSSFPGMDQDEYLNASDDSNNSFEELIEEFDFLRRANTHMFMNLPEWSYSIIGEASGAKVSVRALLHILVGHLEHHRNILRERYL